MVPWNQSICNKFHDEVNVLSLISWKFIIDLVYVDVELIAISQRNAHDCKSNYFQNRLTPFLFTPRY